jgi:hypothetical protein
MLTFSRSRRDGSVARRKRVAPFVAAIALGSSFVAGWAACGTSVGSGSGGHAGSGGASQQGGSTPGTGGATNNGGASTTMSGGGSPGMCDAGCSAPWKCCGTLCAAVYNDIHNCGACGKECPGAHPYCDNGKCAAAPPCADGGPICDGPGFCCGSTCCNDTQLCCDVPGDIDFGPKCVAPENGTCPQGCPVCQ